MSTEVLARGLDCIEEGDLDKIVVDRRPVGPRRDFVTSDEVLVSLGDSRSSEKYASWDRCNWNQCNYSRG